MAFAQTLILERKEVNHMAVKGENKIRCSFCGKTEDQVRKLIAGPDGWLLQRRGEGGLLAGLWQPPLWDAALDEAALREAVARLLGADPGPGAPAGQAKHIFSHVEWQMTGRRFTLTRRLPAPEGCVWATAADLADTRPLPGAFKAWRRVMETEKMPAGPL